MAVNPLKHSVLTTLMETAFENIVGKGKNASNLTHDVFFIL